MLQQAHRKGLGLQLVERVEVGEHLHRHSRRVTEGLARAAAALAHGLMAGTLGVFSHRGVGGKALLAPQQRSVGGGPGVRHHMVVNLVVVLRLIEINRYEL